MKNITHAHLNRDLLSKFGLNENNDLTFDGVIVGTSTIGTGHAHINKEILDKLSVDLDGNLLFDGEIIKSHEHDNKLLLDSIQSFGEKILINEKEVVTSDTYDKDGDGIVDVAYSVAGVEQAKPNQYYGTDEEGNIGFADLNSVVDVPYLTREVIPFEKLAINQRLEICDNRDFTLMSANIFNIKEQNTSFSTERLLDVIYNNDLIKVEKGSNGELKSLIPENMNSATVGEVTLFASSVYSNNHVYFASHTASSAWWATSSDKNKTFTIKFETPKFIGKMSFCIRGYGSDLKKLKLLCKNEKDELVEVYSIEKSFITGEVVTINRNEISQAKPSSFFQLKITSDNYFPMNDLKMFTGYGITNYDTQDHLILTKEIDIKHLNTLNKIVLNGTADFRVIFKYDNEKDWRYLKDNGELSTIYAEIPNKNFEDFTTEELSKYKDTITMIKRHSKASKEININEDVIGRRKIQVAILLEKGQAGTINHFDLAGTETVREQVPSSSTILEYIKEHTYISADVNVLNGGEVEVLKQSKSDTEQVERGHYHTNKPILDKLSDKDNVLMFNDTPVFPREEFKNEILLGLEGSSNTIINEDFLDEHLETTGAKDEIIILKDSKNILLRNASNEVEDIVLNSHYKKDEVYNKEEVFSKSEVVELTTSRTGAVAREITLNYKRGGAWCCIGHISLIKSDGTLLKLSNIIEHSRSSFTSDEIDSTVAGIYHSNYALRTAFLEYHGNCSGYNCHTLVDGASNSMTIKIKNSSTHNIVGIQFTPFPTTSERRGVNEVTIDFLTTDNTNVTKTFNTSSYELCQLFNWKPLREGQSILTNLLASNNHAAIKELGKDIDDKTTVKKADFAKSITLTYKRGGSYCSLGHISLLKSDGTILKLTNIKESNRLNFTSNEIVSTLDTIWGDSAYNLKYAFREFHSMVAGEHCSATECYTLTGSPSNVISISIKNPYESAIVGIQFTPFPTTYERRGADEVTISTTTDLGKEKVETFNTSAYAICQLFKTDLINGVTSVPVTQLAYENSNLIEDLQEKVKDTDLSNYYNKQEVDELIPDVTGLVTQEELNQSLEDIKPPFINSLPKF